MCFLNPSVLRRMCGEEFTIWMQRPVPVDISMLRLHSQAELDQWDYFVDRNLLAISSIGPPPDGGPSSPRQALMTLLRLFHHYLFHSGMPGTPLFPDFLPDVPRTTRIPPISIYQVSASRTTTVQSHLEIADQNGELFQLTRSNEIVNSDLTSDWCVVPSEHGVELENMLLLTDR